MRENVKTNPKKKKINEISMFASDFFQGMLYLKLNN